MSNNTWNKIFGNMILLVCMFVLEDVYVFIWECLNIAGKWNFLKRGLWFKGFTSVESLSSKIKPSTDNRDPF